MITYELAKQLKEAGFTQYSWQEVVLKDAYYIDDKFYGKDFHITISGENIKNWYYVPTLSELIEACGDKFQGIDVYEKKGKKIWRAWKIIEGEKDEDRYVLSDTPEESVAKLWLKLKTEK